MHEYVHFEQDVATGIGHWDFYHRLILRNQVFSDPAIRTSHALSPLPEAIVQSIYRIYAPSLYVDFTDVTRNDELDLITHTLRQESSLDSDVATELAPNFTVQSILELEATCAVYLTILDLKATDAEYQELDALDKLWRPFKMAELYSDPYIFMFQNVARLFDGLDNVKTKINTKIIQFLCSLSLSHPSPIWLQQHAHDMRDYHPGVRLLRMMRRLSSSEAINQDNGAWFGIEEVLRKTDRFEYPTSKDIYLDWICARCRIQPAA
jgi:hypothetical protein